MTSTSFNLLTFPFNKDHLSVLRVAFVEFCYARRHPNEEDDIIMFAERQR